MDTRKTLVALGYVFNLAIGYTVPAVVFGLTKPKGVVESTLTTMGSFALGINVARKFNEEYTTLCKDAFDVDVSAHFT